jgi:two-component system phosphate regulon sensor histidine kinase PhoR
MATELTALVVDDEKVIRDGCCRILSLEGFRVLTAANGREALEVLAAQPVNIILCDLKMPVMGAVEVLEETALRYPNVPVIIITGHGTLDSALECMRKGASDFITKPFRAEHLVMVTRRALNSHNREP